MRTADVNAALRRYYNPREYALMFEVSNATGSNARRHADAVAMSLWPSRGLMLEGIEVKVSRSDWRRELDQPEKAEPVAQYCDKWWIVTPDNIVHEHELPALWGHMAVSENGTIRVKKPAPKKDGVKPLDRHFAAAMLRRASEADAALVDAAVNIRLAAMEKQYQQRVDDAVRRRTAEGTSAVAKLEMLREAGIDPDRVWDGKELAAQIAIGQRLGGLGSNLGYHIQQLSKTLKELTTFQGIIEGKST